MRKILRTSILTLLILIFFSNGFSADNLPGRIEKFERGLQDTIRSAPRPESKSAHEEYSYEADDTSFTEMIIGELMGWVFMGIWYSVGWIPDEANELYNGEQPRLASFPYQSGTSGLYAYPDSTAKLWGFSTSADFLLGTNSLKGSSLSLKLFPLPYFDLAYSHSTLHEDTTGGTDEINLDSYILNYRRFRWPVFNLYWGLGVRTIARRENYSGFALDAGIDLFPAKPLSFSYCYTGSEIRVRWVSEHQTTLRWHWNRLAARGGYRTWQVGEAGLKGWFLGLEAFF